MKPEQKPEVSWTAREPNQVFLDSAHALTDVIDFRDLAGASAEEFHSWRAALGADFRLALLTSRADAVCSLLNAVAVREGKPRLARFYPDMTLAEGDRNWLRMQKEGFRNMFSCDYTKKDHPVSSQLWLGGGGSWSQWGTRALDLLVGKINDQVAQGLRPFYIHGPSPGGDGDFFRVNSGEAAGRKWKFFSNLGAEELLSAVAACGGDRWRPDVLAPYLDGGRLLFMLVTVDNHDAVDWRFRMDMSLQEYRAESAVQKRRGLFPLALVSYRSKSDPRYAAIWVRYRVLTSDP
jgi:hypothetical protein